MKRFRVVILFGVLAFVLAAGWALAGMQDFTLTNNSGSIITNVYVSPSAEDSWGSDILGEDVLEPGMAAAVSFEGSDDVCEWDIMVVTEDGSQSAITGVDLCTTTDVSFE